MAVLGTGLSTISVIGHGSVIFWFHVWARFQVTDFKMVFA